MGKTQELFVYQPRAAINYKPSRHFVDRYRERILQGRKIKKKTLIKFINNFRKEIYFHKEFEYEGRIQHAYVYVPKATALSGTPQWVVVDPETEKLVTLFKQRGIFEEDYETFRKGEEDANSNKSSA